MNFTNVPGSLCPVSKESCPITEELSRLQNEVMHLRKLVRIDSLTNFYNFRHFKEVLTIEMERTRRSGFPTGLIMADLDHFKFINDTYGHEVGNLVLASTAQLWHTQIRQLDIACRYGGEEFAIIMPGTRLAMALLAAERLRLVLAGNLLDHAGQQLALTASFGVDCFQTGDDISADEFVDRTDHYLLEAKRSGRNRVCYNEDRLKERSTELSAEERKLLFTGISGNNDDDHHTQKRHSHGNDKGQTQNAE